MAAIVVNDAAWEREANKGEGEIGGSQAKWIFSHCVFLIPFLPAR